METIIEICPCCEKRWRILKFGNGIFKCTLCLSTWKVKTTKKKGKKAIKKVNIIENKFRLTRTIKLPRGA